MNDQIKIAAFISYEDIPQEYRQNKAFVLTEDLNKVVGHFQDQLAAKDEAFNKIGQVLVNSSMISCSVRNKIAAICEQAIAQKGSEE